MSTINLTGPDLEIVRRIALTSLLDACVPLSPCTALDLEHLIVIRERYVAAAAIGAVRVDLPPAAGSVSLTRAQADDLAAVARESIEDYRDMIDGNSMPGHEEGIEVLDALRAALARAHRVLELVGRAEG